jgi:hypothetical protein
MSDNDKKSNQKQASASEDVGQKEAQRLADEANEKGYIGEVPDPTPNENYTVAGVTSGAPTPETDEKLRAEANQASGRR